MSCGGEGLVLLAALVAFQLAQGRSADQLALIGAFFNVLGDDLTLMAAQRSMPACAPGSADASDAQAAD